MRKKAIKSDFGTNISLNCRIEYLEEIIDQLEKDKKVLTDKVSSLEENNKTIQYKYNDLNDRLNSVIEKYLQLIKDSLKNSDFI